MTRETQRRIRESKQRAAELVRYANPRSKSKPSVERVTELLLMNIPYSTVRPIVMSFNVTGWNRNSIIRAAQYKVETTDGKVWEIDAYEHLKGRTQEQKEADKTATFPSGLFNIFHSDITFKVEEKGEVEGIDYIMVPIYSEGKNDDGGYDIIGERKEYV